jgi:hypothetical protein
MKKNKPLYAVRHSVPGTRTNYYEVYKIGHEDEDGIEKWEYRTESERGKAAGQAMLYRTELNNKA